MSRYCRLIAKAVLCSLMTIVFLLGSLLADAESAYASYTYNWWQEPVISPDYYKAGDLLSCSELSGSTWSAPVDMATNENYLVVLDSGSNTNRAKYVVFDKSYKKVQSIDSFKNQGVEDSFNNPQGIYLTEDNEIYVADTDNSRILKFNIEGELLASFGRPKTEMIDATLTYLPKKVTVDSVGRMYVIATSVNQGLIELTAEGDFLRYVGANSVAYNPIEYIWRYFSTEEQLEQMALFVPTEFTNLDIDESGFVFTVTGTSDKSDLTSSDVIKRLNPKGSDVLNRNGYVAPVGDYLDNTIYSVLVDIAVNKTGIYAALDSIAGRVFIYDSDGNLLVAFAGTGYQIGNLQVPVAISFFGDQILVLDSYLKAIQIYKLTPYGEAVQAATYNYEIGDYENSKNQWETVLQYNANSDLAYTGLGKIALRNNEYKSSMAYFKLAQQRTYYSKAYKLYRREQMSVYFPYIGMGLAILIAAVILWKISRMLAVKIRRWGAGYEKQ